MPKGTTAKVVVPIVKVEAKSEFTDKQLHPKTPGEGRESVKAGVMDTDCFESMFGTPY